MVVVVVVVVVFATAKATTAVAHTAAPTARHLDDFDDVDDAVLDQDSGRPLRPPPSKVCVSSSSFSSSSSGDDDDDVNDDIIIIIVGVGVGGVGVGLPPLRPRSFGARSCRRSLTILQRRDFCLFYKARPFFLFCFVSLGFI